MQFFLITIFIFVSFVEAGYRQVKEKKLYDDKSTQIVYIWPKETQGIDTSIAELTDHSGKRFYNIHNPSLEVYIPKSSNGIGIVICPGGGYNYVASGVEGEPTAQILNEAGITVFVLKYRLPNTPGLNFKHPVPLSDALRALQYVRYNAENFNLDINRIGIMGFSAGGHLASMAGTLFNGYSFGKDDISKTNSRPDFMCLVYPVISTKRNISHSSIKNLVDSSQADHLPNFLSSELNVTNETPPTFLVHAKDDQSVNYQNSVVMFEILRKYGVPADLKLYNNGGHGFGIGKEGTDSVNWIKDFIAWLLKMKYIRIPDNLRD